MPWSQKSSEGKALDAPQKKLQEYCAEIKPLSDAFSDLATAIGLEIFELDPDVQGGLDGALGSGAALVKVRSPAPHALPPLACWQGLT